MVAESNSREVETMGSILDYLQWRGDLPFSRDPFSEVDAVVFSALTYVEFDSLLTEPMTLRQAGERFLARGEFDRRIRVKADLELLRLAAQSERFGACRITMYRDIFIPEQETQFAAMTFCLDDGTLFVAFRGTDGTIVGWKEDFNMTFQQSVPCQRLALDYVRQVCLERPEPLRIGGHSKGGNMAVFAAARSSPMVQERILGVYNNDGPGFTKYMMGDPGYLNMVDRIHTYIPQSSIIGMLLEHEEPYTVIHSKSISVWQHDLYNWELMGKHLLTMDALTEDSVFLDATIKNWFASMTNQERNQLVDAVYALVSASGADRPGEILQMKNIKSYIRTISSDEQLRKMLTTEFAGLIASARKAMTQLESARQEQKRLEEKNE